jgi:hypothetical protein
MDDLIDGSLAELERLHHHLFHYGDDGGLLQLFNELYEFLDQLRAMEDCPSNAKQKLDSALGQLGLEALNERVTSAARDLVDPG